MNNLVSIIIPLFNREFLIEETIQSILNQTYENIEIIVIDDHSTDNSFSVVSAIKNDRIILLRRPSTLKKGANSCRNFGLMVSKGKYVKWIDSDDLLDENAIELQVKGIHESKANLSVCIAKKFLLDSEAQDKIWLNEWGSLLYEPTIENFCNYKFIWHTCSGLWESEFVTRHLKWNESLQNSQEWLFHLQALVNGIKVSIVRQNLCFIRMHQGSMSDSSHKKARYYFHECLARFYAVNYLLQHNNNTKGIYRKIFKKMTWYHLFIFYKGNIFLGIEAISFYPIIFFNFIKFYFRRII